MTMLFVSYLPFIWALFHFATCQSFSSEHQEYWQQQPLQQRKDGHGSWTYKNPLDVNQFQDYINSILDEFHAPGLAIAIIHNNSTWSKGFGYSHLDAKNKIPVTPHTLFFAGSTTKSFTAASTGRLVYNDSLDISWTTPISSLIPEDFVLQDEYATAHITLEDALSHRTGMPRHDQAWLNSDPSVREQVRRLRLVSLHRELRQAWEYCNLMFTSVALAVETVCGIAFGTLLQEWFLKPLGMNETAYSLSDAFEIEEQSQGEVRMARGYIWDNETKTYWQVPFDEIPPENGAGGIISNVLDYTKWIRQFLFASASNTKQPAIVSSDIVRDMTAPHMLVPAGFEPYELSTYGLGLDIQSYRGCKLIGHQGSIAGYMTSMYWIPELEWGFAVFQNADSLAVWVTQWALVDDVLDQVGAKGQPFDIWNGAKQIEWTLGDRLRNGRQVAYPGAPDVAPIGPALPLQAYEGTYRHPAYQNITLSIKSSSKPGDAQGGAPLPLLGVGSEKSYLNQTWTFNHVSGEHWWVHSRHGPGFFLEDEILRAEFEIGVDGAVAGMGLEPISGAEGIGLFKKIV